MRQHRSWPGQSPAAAAGLIGLLAVALLLAAAPQAGAQEEPALKLHLGRDFGYGGFGQIQGLFTLSASGPSDLQRVTFRIDGEPMGEDAEAPFKLQFHTDSYPPGRHALSAAGVTAGRAELGSDEITVEFLSGGAASKATTRVVLPIVGLVAAILVALVVTTLLSARRHGSVPLGQPRQYGASGGAICPKCQRPFPLSAIGLNLAFARLTVCPHCRKWVRVRPRRLEELRAAEASELRRAEGSIQAPEVSGEERLRKAIDDSRYQGS
jgi:hypothetical protein